MLSKVGGGEGEMWAVTNSGDKENTLYLVSRVEGRTRTLSRMVWCQH